MKVAVIGSRNIKDFDAAYKLMCEKLPKNCSEIVSGGALGADTLAEKYAKENDIHLTVFLPEFEKYGKAAPLIRNTKIIEYADIVYAFWDMKSPGTAKALDKCIKTDKPFKIIKI